MRKPLDLTPLHKLLTEELSPKDMASVIDQTVQDYVYLLLACSDYCLPMVDTAGRIYQLQLMRERLLEIDKE